MLFRFGIARPAPAGRSDPSGSFPAACSGAEGLLLPAPRSQCKAQVYNGAMTTLITKPEIASIQLRTALQHFCGGDYIPAITLAGAAEEILGKLANAAGIKNALEEDVSFIEARLHVRDCAIPRKDLITWMNRYRDQLKHIGVSPSDPVAINAFEAADDMIERAVQNYLHVYREWPDFDGAYEMYYRTREEMNRGPE